MDETDSKEPLTEVASQFTNRPPNGSDWVHQVDGEVVGYDDLLICCADTPAPTYFPTEQTTPTPRAPTTFESSAPTPAQIPCMVQFFPYFCFFFFVECALAGHFLIS